MAIAIRTPGDRAGDDTDIRGGRPLSIQRVHEPDVAHRVLAGTGLAWMWLLVRVYVGWRWLAFASARLRDPSWLTGARLAAPLRATLSAVHHHELPAWYGGFVRTQVLGHPALWARGLADAQAFLGFAVLVGAWTGLSVLLGILLVSGVAVMGTMSLDPLTLALALALLLAWRAAGWWGLDRWILPLLGCTLHTRAEEAGRAPSG